MNRPVGIAVTSILQFMFGLMYLLLAVLCSTGQYFVPKMSKPKVLIGFLSLAFAAIGIATAVGVFRLKSWSRYLPHIRGDAGVCGPAYFFGDAFFACGQQTVHQHSP